MIKQDNIIKADEGKILLYKPENKLWGKAARLATYKGHQLTVEDFSEIDETDAVKIDGMYYVFYNWKYADIVEFIIKCKYTYDAQIALMLNYQEFPDQYQEKYNEMQEWRKFAKEAAMRFTEKQEG